MSYAPPSTARLSLLKVGEALKRLPFHFDFEKRSKIREKAAKPFEKIGRLVCPFGRAAGDGQGRAQAPFGAHKKGGAPPLIGGFRKDKPKKRPRIRKTTRVYAVVCSPQQRLFMCGHYARPPSGHARFSARRYSFDAHSTDGRHSLGFAGLPRGLQAHPPENNIFLRAKPNAPARRAVPARGRRCCRPVRPTSIFAPRAWERRRLFYMENIKYAYSRPFPLKKHRSAPTVQSQASSLPFGGTPPRVWPARTSERKSRVASACPAARQSRAF